MAETIGHVIHPSWSYDLEASLRVHRMLVKRAMKPEWRFRNTWVVTGPLETLLGYPNCGSGSGGTRWFSLNLMVRDGMEEATKTVNRRILDAMCRYPTFAALDETVTSPFRHCGEAFSALVPYETGRTRRQLNRHHKKASLVKDVCLCCNDSGVFLSANVSFSTRPAESRWELWWLAERGPRPRWNERLKLATWLSKAKDKLNELVRPRETTQ